MWKGKVTEELRTLYKQYLELFDGMPPDGYEELDGCYDISYDEFVGYIKKCIKQKNQCQMLCFQEYMILRV